MTTLLPDRLVRISKLKRKERMRQLEDICSMLLVEFELDPTCVMETEDDDLARAAQEYGFNVLCQEYIEGNKYSISVPDLQIHDE